MQAFLRNDGNMRGSLHRRTHAEKSEEDEPKSLDAIKSEGHSIERCCETLMKREELVKLEGAIELMRERYLSNKIRDRRHAGSGHHLREGGRVRNAVEAGHRNDVVV